jgi:hypothetical protein
MKEAFKLKGIINYGDLTDSQLITIQRAHAIYGDITPCANYDKFDHRSFSEGLFYFNTKTHSTRIMKHEE